MISRARNMGEQKQQCVPCLYTGTGRIQPSTVCDSIRNPSGLLSVEQSGNIMESEHMVGTCKCEKRRMVYGLGIEGDLKILI